MIGIILGVVFGAIGLAVLLAVVYVVTKYNRFKKMEIKIEESKSAIDIALNKRFDLLTKEYDICKGYLKHESSVLQEVTRLRGDSTTDIGRLSQINNGLSRLSDELRVTVENYPVLKADGIFVNLMNSSREVEETLESSRRIYNSNVSLYNQEIALFPNSMIANWFHFTKKELFVVEERRTEDVKMEF